jgi:hypothetical protein
MKNYSCLLVLCVNIVLTLPAVAQEKYYSFIAGTVVDEKGRSVNRAKITFDTLGVAQEKSCWAKEHELLTDGAGHFLLQEHCDITNRTIVLFTTAAPGLGDAEFPIFAPFWPELRKNDPRFAGLRVELKGNQKLLDLGKIPVQVWYNRVELFVTNKEGKPYYKSEDDWANFELIVRDKNGVAVGNEGLSTFDRERSVRVDRGSVNLALPEGTWTLELLRSLDDFDNKGRTLRYLAKTNISVKRTDVCLQARLVVK